MLLDICKEGIDYKITEGAVFLISHFLEKFFKLLGRFETDLVTYPEKCRDFLCVL